MNVRMEGNKVIVEFEIEEYFELYQILKEASRYRGTGTPLLARSLLQKIKEGSKNDPVEPLWICHSLFNYVCHQVPQGRRHRGGRSDGCGS